MERPSVVLQFAILWRRSIRMWSVDSSWPTQEKFDSVNHFILDTKLIDKVCLKRKVYLGQNVSMTDKVYCGTPPTHTSWTPDDNLTGLGERSSRIAVANKFRSRNSKGGRQPKISDAWAFNSLDRRFGATSHRLYDRPAWIKKSSQFTRRFWFPTQIN